MRRDEDIRWGGEERVQVAGWSGFEDGAVGGGEVGADGRSGNCEVLRSRRLV